MMEDRLENTEDNYPTLTLAYLTADCWQTWLTLEQVY